MRGGAEPDEKFEWLAENWTARLADALEGITGERPEASWRPSQTLSLAGDALWWEQPLSLHRDAILWVGAPEAAWLEIGSHILRGAGIDVTGPSDARNTYLEILSQACSGLAQAIAKGVGKEVVCEGGSEQSGPQPDARAFEVEVHLAGTRIPALGLCVHPALFAPARSEVVRAAPATPAEVHEPAAPPRGEAPAPERSPRTLDLLMEVDLPVSVSFGRAQLPLKDVLKLSIGSIVELNRTLTEPVEVIVNNCVIARGEVVVVEGNYGVRIQEVISREKRLRTLQ
jgi:flagellar motor switch protein FliN/FliY